jgi:hypothetical protein
VSEEKARSPSTFHGDTVSSKESHPERKGAGVVRSFLNNFLAVMNATGDDAQEKYESALSELRKFPEEAVIEITRAEDTCNEFDYPTRWGLVHAASELRHLAALPLLTNIVATPIPPEQSQNPHSYSTVAEETILRTTAVDGVRYLAEQGNEEAVRRLFGFLEQPSISIRRASVQAILSVKKDKATREQLASMLPADQRFLVEIKPVDVRDVPQVEHPERYLGEAAKRREKKKQPMFPAQRQADKGESQPGPKAGK